MDKWRMLTQVIECLDCGRVYVEGGKVEFPRLLVVSPQVAHVTEVHQSRLVVSVAVACLGRVQFCLCQILLLEDATKVCVTDSSMQK